jgi:hypothetical protein
MSASGSVALVEAVRAGTWARRAPPSNMCTHPIPHPPSPLHPPSPHPPTLYPPRTYPPQRPPVGRRHTGGTAAGGVPGGGSAPSMGPRGPRSRSSMDGGGAASSPTPAMSPALASSPYAQKPGVVFPAPGGAGGGGGGEVEPCVPAFALPCRALSLRFSLGLLGFCCARSMSRLCSPRTLSLFPIRALMRIHAVSHSTHTLPSTSYIA